jgi:hypothetical protein
MGRRFVQQRIYCRFSLVTAALLIGGSLGTAGSGWACTIPVFRYALERWEADRLLVVVYHDGALSAEDDAAARKLAASSRLVGGPLNIEVLRYDVSADSPPRLVGVQPPKDQPLPWVEIRAPLDSVNSTVRWQGPLAEVVGRQDIFDSPARGEIVRRLLAGHSAVWLAVAPEGQEKQQSEKLQALLDSFSKELVLPQGIGLPGSELYASIPLEIRFSVVSVAHSDPAEQAFFKQLASAAAEWKTDAAYAIPVFGRLRALEVFPMADVDELLIRDVSEFLCGACSCQVKQANPGFDLLASVTWEERLFSGALPEGVAPESSAAMAAAANSEVTQYVAIPEGRGSAAKEQTPAEARKAGPEPRKNIPDGMSHRTSQFLLVLAVVALLGGIVGVVLLKKR